MYQKSTIRRVWLWAAALVVAATFTLGQTAAYAKPPAARKVGRASAKEAAAMRKAALLVAGNGVGLPVLGATLMQVIWGGIKDTPSDPPPPTPPAPPEPPEPLAATTP